MPRPAGHPLAGGLLIVAAVLLLAIAAPGGAAPDPVASSIPPDPSGGTAAAGGALDLDLGQLVSCASVEPAGGAASGRGPRISVAAGSDASRGELRRLTQRVALRVERIRGLRFEGPIDVAFLDDAGLRRRLDALARREYGPRQAELDGRVLVELGAVPADTDLLALSTETLEGQVAGLYIPQTRELLVRSAGGDPGAIELLTVSHELEHALADQTLGLPVANRPRPERADATAARLALIEGDATLAMQLYSQEYLSLADQLTLLGDGSLADSQEQFDSLPDFLQRQLIFPYAGGLSFACERAADGGMSAIDRAYRRPPESTWEILFPERPPGGRPATPPSGPGLGRPWRLGTRTQLGAAQLSWLFAAPGGEPARALADPEGAVEGWLGDSLELWTDGTRSAVGISVVSRGNGLCAAIGEWYRRTDPDAEAGEAEPGTLLFDGIERDAAISCEDGLVRVGIAPDAGTAEKLAGYSAPRAASSGAAG